MFSEALSNDCGVCQSCSRLLKNANVASATASQNSRPCSVTRRITPTTISQRRCTVVSNKENISSAFLSGNSPPKHYGGLFSRSQDALSSPPRPVNNSPPKFALGKLISPPCHRQPLEDFDPNSQDSGYGTFFPDKDETKMGFRFAEPLGVAPKRINIEPSPKKESTVMISPPQTKCAINKHPLFHSYSSGSESLDDGFLDVYDIDKLDEETQLPSGMGSLLSGPIFGSQDYSTEEFKNVMSETSQAPLPTFRRSLSLSDSDTPCSSRARSCLFKPKPSLFEPTKGLDNSALSIIQSELSPFTANRQLANPFKRPDPPREVMSPVQNKRRKSSLHTIGEEALLRVSDSEESLLQVCSQGKPAMKFQRSFSETEATIMKALQKSSQDPDLIGDFTRPFALPLMDGRHQDLKSISSDTLAALMNGEYCENINNYTVIDCRYPYEFEGGHIKGAKNMFTKEQIYKELVDSREVPVKGEMTKRNVLVFHCEFSSERGPTLSRFLRNSDRELNKECYPALYYPEVYLLHGGYKAFFDNYQDMCEPCAYRPMLDPNHETDLKHFRAKSKSWNGGDSKSRLALRNSLKRLGL